MPASTWTRPDTVLNFPLQLPQWYNTVPPTTKPGQLEAGAWEVGRALIATDQYNRLKDNGTAPKPTQIGLGQVWRYGDHVLRENAAAMMLRSKDGGSYSYSYDLQNRRVDAKGCVEIWADDATPDRGYSIVPYLMRAYQYTVKVPGANFPQSRPGYIYQPMTITATEQLGRIPPQGGFPDGRRFTYHWEMEGSIDLVKKTELPTPDVRPGETLDKVLDGGVYFWLLHDMPIGPKYAFIGYHCEWTSRSN